MSQKPKNLQEQEANLHFTCVYEKDTLPTLDPEADIWFQQARALEKVKGKPDYATIGRLYRQAAEKDHYKALFNLQNLIRYGKVPPRTGMHPPQEVLELVEKLIKLNIPLGYYQMGYLLDRGYAVKQDKTAALTYFRKAADMGNPAGQYIIGDLFVSPGLLDDRDNPAYYPEIGEEMLKCSIEQGFAKAGHALAVQHLYTDKNYAKAAYYFQEAVKHGYYISAMRLVGSFQNPTPQNIDYYLALPQDPERARRYNLISDESFRFPEARFPDIDKIVPLPPAPLPEWDGTFEYKKQQEQK
ncbi:SEL1-like repeat protein [Xenorhabdus szentirmaii]|nr:MULTISPECIES: DUF6396 domain-containing protein [Xenorhabdus]MBD2793850.1 sel1 repeat family protein [Xenorhabdus sp. CUL]MBD2805565.1 sel1 repeat family protein [Xenorhabdus sp. ZM]MBD2821645.1 sel1 repeat family protein [Xenorhabdus sp. 42]MBD2823934.1 sel1 repeat family protein [Xenorhabdus sp. 5]